MKPFLLQLSTSVYLPLILVTSAHAQSRDVTDAASSDKSGTNPAVLMRSFGFSAEYLDLPSADHLTVTNLKFSEPFDDGKMSLRFNVPLIDSHVGGHDDSGIGDIGVKWNYIPYLTKKDAALISAEISLPTASHDSIGSDKWVFSPGITYAYFLSKNVIIAPAYVHNISFAGNDNRSDVHRSDLDLYLVYTADDKSWWLTSDLTLSIDYNNHNKTPASWEVQYGRTLGKLAGGALNGYVKPGIGIGSDRNNDWNIEIGFSLVGF
jgi:hypothetical protein